MRGYTECNLAITTNGSAAGTHTGRHTLPALLVRTRRNQLGTIMRRATRVVHHVIRLIPIAIIGIMMRLGSEPRQPVEGLAVDGALPVVLLAEVNAAKWPKMSLRICGRAGAALQSLMIPVKIRQYVL